MATFQIYKNLAWLNEMSVEDAESAFLDCCGSPEWARRMAAARPFALFEKLYNDAETFWFSLTNAHWLEAFASNPKIGSNNHAEIQQFGAAGEKSGVDATADKWNNDFAEANCLYEDKFGFIFTVCASGKRLDEMLAICRARLSNSAETELHIAAEEQRKITEIRLSKLFEQ